MAGLSWREKSKRTTNAFITLVFLATQFFGFGLVFASQQANAVVNECVTDTAGADDEPGQKDLTKLCVDDTVSGEIDLNFNWDQTDWSGNNSGDACALFDTDNDGFVNYSVCVVVKGSPAAITSTVLYSCGDAKPDRCTSTVTTLPINNGTSCTVAITNDDPFNVITSNDEYPNDTKATCTLDLDDVGGAANAELIDVCSYPSQQPNSDPSDCVIIKDNTAFIRLIKQVEPNTDTGKFNLLINGTAEATDVGDEGTTGIVNVDASNSGGGTSFTVSETAGTGTSLSNYTSTVQCVTTDDKGTVTTGSLLSATQTSVTLKPDYMAVCTFTNTRQTASITIVKNAIPDTTTNFNFTSDVPGSTSFSLDDETGFSGTQAGTDSTPESKTMTVPTGTYTFTEAETNGWYLDAIECPNITETKNLANRTVTLTVTSGQNITCTFENRAYGQLQVTKQTDPNGDNTQFNISASPSAGVVGSANQTIVDDQTVTYQVKQGTYAVTEDLTNTPGWTKNDSACANLVIDADHLTRSCTITNTKLSKLKIVKDAVPDDAQDFSFTTTGTGLSNFILDDDADSTRDDEQQFSGLAPGSYSVTESTVVGWQLTNLACTGINYSWNGTTNVLNLTLPAGADVSCIFTNTKLGSISGTKYEVDAGATTGTKTLAGWVICLDANNNNVCDPSEASNAQTTDANGNFTFGSLLPGVYGLFETLKDGWTQIFSPNDVDLSAGEVSTGNDFGNFKNATINGYKWNDVNGNGVYDNEPKLGGWTISLYDDQDNLLDTVDTDAVTGYSFINLTPGDYKVCETQKNGWTQTYPATNGGCHLVSINVSGETETANFGNQGRGTIQVVKNVDTDGDGDLDIEGATNWTWDIDGSGNYATGSTQNVAAGNYSVSEDQKANYHATLSNCTGEDNSLVSETKSVTVSPGENVLCTFNNTRDTGTLVLKKHVVNDNGGKAEAGDFNLHVKQTGVDVAGSPAAGSESGTEYILITGDYTVSEDAPVDGYTMTSIVCDGQETATVSVTTGQSKTCVITNDDIAPKLTVKKIVDNSGTNLTKTASDFTMNVAGTNVSDNSFAGSTSGVTVTLDQGTYKVTEDPDSNYSVSYSADCDSTINVGEEKTCTVTNTAILKPGIHVEKSGPSTAHEGDTVTYTFTVTNPGNAPLDNITVSDNVAGLGVYQSGDTSNIGFLDPGETWIYKKDYVIPTPQIANVDNTVTVCGDDAADTNVCDTDDHTLDVLHPSITVVKDGPLYGYEGQLIGYTFVVTNTGDTTLMNVGINDDIADAETCDDTFLNPGESTNCTAQYLIPIPTTSNVVNNVVASGTDPLDKTVTDTDDHTLDVIHPGINVVKSGPSTAHEGDTVTYTFTVTNTGDIALSSVTVSDNVAGNAVYQSGDTNGNDKLDLTETWIFTKDYTIPAEQTADVVNTATACGYDPIQAVLREKIATCDTDNHTLDVLHPGIHVDKSGPATAYEGETVTYSFTVTNTGDTPLSITTVNDNVAGAGEYQSGDVNDNDKLDLSETWIYTKQYTIPADSDDILNTVTVCGEDALEGEACDEDEHNTHVYHPMITVTKHVYTAQQSDNGSFNLQIDGNTHATGGDATTTGSVLVTPGSHTVGETGANGTDLSDYDTVVYCWRGESFLAYEEATSVSGIEVSGDQHAECHVYNTRHAHLTIVKDAVSNSTQLFDFTLDKQNECEELSRVTQLVDGSLTDGCSGFENIDNFQLQDYTDPTKASKFHSLSQGTYKVTEMTVAGWNLTNVVCTGLDGFTWDSTSAVELNLAAGDDVTCTYTNTKEPEVLGAVTTPLVDTGDGIVANLMIGISAMLLAVGLAVLPRRQTNS